MRFLRAIGQAALLLSLSCALAGASNPPHEPRVPAAETIVPVLEQTGWVTDAADILPDAVETRLAAKLAKLERRTRHQIVVITVPTLAGHDVAEVADHLGNAWHVGRAGHNDGVVVLVAPNERRVRISTAVGMHELLPDETCQQIIEEVMAPHFRADDLPGGIEAGTDALIAQIG